MTDVSGPLWPKPESTGMPILPKRIEPQLDADAMPRVQLVEPLAAAAAAAASPSAINRTAAAAAAAPSSSAPAAPERDARDRELQRIEDKPQWDQTEIDQCLVKLAKVGRVAVVVVVVAALVVVVVVVVVVGPVSRRR